jgi:nitrite reductase/ring-hydroxylating ferredoxin subunit
MAELHPSDGPCTADCESHDRRAFLKEGLMAVAALTALGATADRLGALTLRYAEGRAVGSTLRYPLPAADGATIDAANKVVIARYQGSVIAFSRRCPHRQTPLEWQAPRGRFYCPKHKSTFQPDGVLIQGKAERHMDRYPVRIEGSEVVVDTARAIRSSVDAAAWEAAEASVG